MKAILYARVSKEEQNPEMQKHAMVQRAEREGWDYKYVEERETTRKTRPIKNRIYQEALRGNYDIICVWKIDRWARSVIELSTNIDTLYKRGVKFISLNDNIDLSTPAGKFQFHVFSAVAEFERELIRMRTKEALDYRKKEIEEKGFFISKRGKKVTSLGRPKGVKDKKPRRKSGYHMRWAKDGQ